MTVSVTTLSDVTAGTSAPPLEAAPLQPVTFGEAWNLCYSERERALCSARMARSDFADDPRHGAFAAAHDRHAAIFLMLLTLVDRVGNDGGIKDRLQMIADAENERAARLAEQDAPDAEIKS